MKKASHPDGASREYINALNKLHSIPFDTPIRATAQSHRLQLYGRNPLSQRSCPMSAVLCSDGVQGDAYLIDSGSARCGRTTISPQEIKDRLREIETAIVSMDAPFEEKADVCELVEGFLDRLSEDVLNREAVGGQLTVITTIV
jgi:hypothetical protein